MKKKLVNHIEQYKPKPFSPNCGLDFIFSSNYIHQHFQLDVSYLKQIQFFIVFELVILPAYYSILITFANVFLTLLRELRYYM